jgi:hypothetical protein
MTNSQTSRLAVIAVIAASLLAVGVIAAISLVKQAEAQITVDLNMRNRFSGTNTATTTQSSSVSSSGSCTTCTAANSATTGQSNAATQSNSISVVVN